MSLSALPAAHTRHRRGAQVAAGAQARRGGLVWTEAGIRLAYAGAGFVFFRYLERASRRSGARRMEAKRRFRRVLPPILRENKFHRYFIGQTVSLLGDQVTLALYSRCSRSTRHRDRWVGC
jgi:hypothetical protein